MDYSLDQTRADLLTPPRREKLHEKIASQVRTLILSDKIGIGQKLPAERDLASQLDVSRVVVREALRSLEQQGLIEIRPGMTGGAFVVDKLHMPLSNIASDLVNSGKLSLSHVVGARKAIECYSIGLAVKNAESGDIEKLHRIDEGFLVDMADKWRFRERHASFHIILAELSGNPLVKLMVQSIFELLNRLRPDTFLSQKFITDTYERHEAILGAMTKKNIRQCEELIAIDVEYTGRLRRIRLRLRDS